MASWTEPEIRKLHKQCGLFRKADDHRGQGVIRNDFHTREVVDGAGSRSGWTLSLPSVEF